MNYIGKLKRLAELSGLFYNTLQALCVYAVIVAISLALVNFGITNILCNYPYYVSFILFVAVLFFVFKNWNGIIIRLGKSSIIHILTDCIAIIVLGIIDIYMKVITHSIYQCFLWIFITIVIISVIKLTKSYHRKKQPNERIENQSPSPLESVTAEELLNWSQNDNPIENIGQDYFNHYLISMRIAQYLEKLVNNNIPSIGLRGEYGSGKTTIINLTKQIIQYNCSQRYIFCIINCWGFSNTKSAIQHIIEKMIQSMTQKGIYTDHLIKIPLLYIQALSKVHTILDVMFLLLINNNDDPKELLKKIGKALELEHKRLVLIIENLDRNESDDFKFDDIQATLMRIKEISHLSFILTGFPSSSEKRIDFEKLCDYIEEV
jgi:hypothetical protein